MNAGDTELTSELKSRIKDDLSSRYTDSSIKEMLDIATFLDSRFKAKYLCGAETATIKQKLVRELQVGESAATCSIVKDSNYFYW